MYLPDGRNDNIYNAHRLKKEGGNVPQYVYVHTTYIPRNAYSRYIVIVVNDATRRPTHTTHHTTRTRYRYSSRVAVNITIAI